jgi:hypothetical protein
MTAPLRVLCCYVPGKLNPATDAALTRYAPQAERIDVSGDGSAYWRTLCAAWADGRSFANVEQDVEIGPDTIPQFETCPEPWCLFPYRVETPPHLRSRTTSPVCDIVTPQVLGAVRFRRALMLAHPDALASLPPERRAWMCLDGFLTLSLADRGVGAPHIHHPGCWHHHPTAYHGDPAADPARFHGPYAATDTQAATARARTREVDTRSELELIAAARLRSGRLDWSPATPEDYAAMTAWLDQPEITA